MNSLKKFNKKTNNINFLKNCDQIASILTN